MSLTPSVLETQLNALAKQELSPEEANAKFANIITNYIKTAQVNGQGTGTGNMGAPVATVVTGNLS